MSPDFHMKLVYQHIMFVFVPHNNLYYLKCNVKKSTFVPTVPSKYPLPLYSIILTLLFFLHVVNWMSDTISYFCKILGKLCFVLFISQCHFLHYKSGLWVLSIFDLLVLVKIESGSSSSSSISLFVNNLKY